MRRLVFAALAMAAFAQQPSVVFRTTTNLVVLDVAVRDRAGKEITGLDRNAFTLLEDGKPQQLAIFEFQQLNEQPLPPIATPSELAPKAVPVKNAAIATAAPGKVQYQDKRLMVMFFDFSSMQPPEQLRAMDAAMEFISRRMASADMVSIMTFGTNLEVQQDFTSDRDRLMEVVRGFRAGEASELAKEGDNADTETGEDTGAAFLADESEFNIFNTDRKLAALESATKMLAALPEKKALIYFSSGVGKTGVENQSQLRSTVNAAVRANVSFYPVDARGLTAMVPGGDASQASSRGTGIFTGQQQQQQQSRMADQHETLVTLASDTGGKALLDSNDLAMGFTQAQQDIHSYYILGYYSSNPAQDGRYRRVQVRLASNPQAKLDYRTGYFGPKQFGQFTSEDKEQHLQEALMLGDPITDLPLALEVNYFRIGRDRYFVPVAVKIPGSEVALAKHGSNEVTEFDFIGQVRDARGRLSASVRDGIRVKLNETSAAQLGRRNFQYDTGFTLAPGKYSLKFLARENQTGKMGTFETTFEVPDLLARNDRLRISSVVWGSQREPVEAAVGSAESKKKLMAANPLVEGGQKLVPSITRVFRKDQNLYVFLEVYDPAAGPAGGAPSIAATLGFYRGRVKAFESEPVKLTAPGARPGAVPVRFQVPLEKLRPGRYTCQVSVVDEVGRKFAFPRAPLVLLESAR
ncbi:MAG TPA: VWA domain-containing protein [Bryobacteraceae bacterium]|nr:VWA domain-containing protein [Bryobacteraceae bacterium]